MILVSENVLHDANRACHACPMRDECEGPVPAEGPMNADIALIGEAPGRNEDKQGRPWRGQAGQFLKSLLSSIGLSMEDVWLSNMSKCRPKGNRTPTPEEAAFCASRWLDVELSMVKPKIIGLLGDVAISYFMGEGTVFERHGKPVYQKESILLPIYHPAAGLYDKGEGRIANILEDFQVLGELVRGDWKQVMDEYPEPDYSGTPDSNKVFLDTETVDGKLWSVQLSAKNGTARFIPAEEWTSST
jgi:uracil-DNA glycosylase family 4